LFRALRGGIPKKIVLTVWPPKLFASRQIFGLATLLVLLKDCWEPHKTCLGAARDFQKSGFNLLAVQHLKWLWHHVTNIDCCGQFGCGKIGFQL